MVENNRLITNNYSGMNLIRELWQNEKDDFPNYLRMDESKFYFYFIFILLLFFRTFRLTQTIPNDFGYRQVGLNHRIFIREVYSYVQLFEDTHN